MIRISAPNKTEINYNSSRFPGGETHVILTDLGLISDYRKNDPHCIFTITASLLSADDIMELLLVTNALKNLNIKVDLVLLYVPYGRQDRICNPGESFSLKVFAGLVNQQDYENVFVLDPHSDVTTALIDRCHKISNFTFVSDVFDHLNCPDELLMVAPDAGAAKKIYDISARLNVQVITAEKVRDLKTTRIIKTEVHSDDLSGKVCLIVDDICDGGRTFQELAKVLKEKNASRIILAVTHGIFSKGLEPFIGLIDTIYTTNSCPPPIETNDINFNFFNYEFSGDLLDRCI